MLYYSCRSSQSHDSEEVCIMLQFMFFISITVIGGVICHYLTKWLDSIFKND